MLNAMRTDRRDNSSGKYAASRLKLFVFSVRLHLSLYESEYILMDIYFISHNFISVYI